jgi:hypothetical protein
MSNNPTVTESRFLMVTTDFTVPEAEKNGGVTYLDNRQKYRKGHTYFNSTSTGEYLKKLKNDTKFLCL